jgi:hypothetical protein
LKSLQPATPSPISRTASNRQYAVIFETSVRFSAPLDSFAAMVAGKASRSSIFSVSGMRALLKPLGISLVEF